MVDVGVKTLISLGHRLSQLEETKDTDEATRLLKWLRSGGLESLKPTLDLYLEEMRYTVSDIYKFKVRLFTQWKTIPFQAASFNTLQDLREQIAKEFKIPPNEFGLNIGYLMIPPGKSNEELIGVRFRGTGLKNSIKITVYPFQSYVEGQSLYEPPLPNVHWFEDSKGQFTVPTEIMRADGRELRFLIPITRETGMAEFDEDVEGILEPRGIVNFRGPFLRRSEEEEEWPEDADVFEQWNSEGFGPLRLEEINPQGESRLQVIMREMARGKHSILSDSESEEEPNVEYLA